MKDLGFHVLLFLMTSAVIVTMGSFFASRSEAQAFSSLPRRYLTFVVGCALVVAVMLAVEHTLAWGG